MKYKYKYKYKTNTNKLTAYLNLNLKDLNPKDDCGKTENTAVSLKLVLAGRFLIFKLKPTDQV